MNSHPRIGMIGLGVMAHRMLSNMNAHGGFTAHTAWDPDATACAKAAAAFPELQITANAGGVINDPDTDVVYIAAPPAFHREYALAAADAGKTVFCEKPLGIDIDESRALVKETESKGVANAVNFPFASAAAVAEMETALADGTIGDVKAVDIRLHFCKWPRDWQVPAEWLSQRAQGGFVRETFSHYAYLTQKLFGPVQLNKAITRYPDDGISAETHALALMDCGGIPISFAGGTGGINASGADRIDFTIWGSKRCYRLYDWNRLRSSDGRDGGAWVEHLKDIPDTRQDGYRRQLLSLGRFIDGDTEALPSFADALAVQELVEDILAS